MALPGINLTEGPDVYYSTLRSTEDFVVFRVNMLGGDDKLYTIGICSLDLWMGEGNDYAQLNLMYNVTVHGEGGNDTVDVARYDYSFTFDAGDGADRLNLLYDTLHVNVAGGTGNDSFYGYRHTIFGAIDGGAGDDLFDGFGKYGGSTVTLAGGAGNDSYYVDPASPPTILENVGAGTDTVILIAAGSYSKPANVENVVAFGGSPPPPPPPSGTITGDDLANTLAGTSAAESIYGLGGNDTIRGYAGNDLLDGGTGNDRLYGGTGADKLYGGDGADTLRGDAGRDEMWGGAGADGFIFDDSHFGGATATTCDVIHDFNGPAGDTIRLNLVDANKGLIGDQVFAFIGTAAFGHVAGQLRYEQISGNTYIQGDVNGDAVADFWIRLDGPQNLSALNFVL